MLAKLSNSRLEGVPEVSPSRFADMLMSLIRDESNQEVEHLMDRDSVADHHEECNHEEFPTPSSHQCCHHDEEEISSPPMSIFDDENLKLRVATIELPGPVENLAVNLKEQTLTISGSRPNPFESADGVLILDEREYGDFSALIPVPRGTEAGSVKAVLQRGLLMVTVPLVNQTIREKPIEVIMLDKSDSAPAVSGNLIDVEESKVKLE